MGCFWVDAVLRWKCHIISPVEIKCPAKIKDLTVKEGAEQCDFLVVIGNGTISRNPAHKYATQINSQMTIIGAQQGYFVVWTKKDIFIEMIPFRKDLWQSISNNLEIFCKIMYRKHCYVSSHCLTVENAKKFFAKKKN